MITESEFVMLQAFDRTLFNSVDAGQRIINAKNSQLVSHSNEIARLRSALAAETGKRRLAQLSATTGARRLAQLQGRAH